MLSLPPRKRRALCGVISQRAGPNWSSVLVHTRAHAVMSAACMNEPRMPKMGIESRRAEPRPDPSDPWRVSTPLQLRLGLAQI